MHVSLVFSVQVPEDDVWILSTLYEIMFLRKLAQELHWKEDTTVNKPLSVSKSTLIFVVSGRVFSPIG